MIRFCRKFYYYLICAIILPSLLSCRNSTYWRKQADSKAEKILRESQENTLGYSEEISVESAEDTLRRRLLLDQNLQYHSEASLGIHDLSESEHWKAEKHLNKIQPEKITLEKQADNSFTLREALQIAAANSREFQSRKDALFRTALALDLEAEEFRNTFTGMMRGEISTSGEKDSRVTGVNNPGKLSVARKFRNGVELSSALSVNLVKMLSGDRSSYWGVLGDASVSVPLLRGSGEFVVTESLTQAERNLVYAVREFEQYKRSFLVRISQSYLNVLQAGQRVQNQEANYERVVASTRRSRRMADAGRLPEYQFDQSVQDELNARDRWVSSRQSFESALDGFKVLIGLPVDAKIKLPEEELQKLEESLKILLSGEPPLDYSGKVPPADAPVELKMPDSKISGSNEIKVEKAIEIALQERLDLQTLADKVADMQRKVRIAEDALRGELTLGSSASMGQSRGLSNTDPGDAAFRTRSGRYGGFLNFNLPLERTAERNAYRQRILELENAVRTYQGEEDQIKQTVRGNLRQLLEFRETLIIQNIAVTLAARRVDSTDLLLQAGRAEIRDLLEAQSALLSAQNSLTSALVNYRIQELELQSNLGVLLVSADGVWQEMDLSVYK